MRWKPKATQRCKTCWRGEVARGLDADALILRIVGPLWLSVMGPGSPLPDAFVEQTVDIVLAGTPGVRPP